MESDKEMIFGLIQSQAGGFKAMNCFVRGGIQSALSSVREHFEEARSRAADPKLS